MKKIIISVFAVVIVITIVIFLQNKTYSKYKKGININIQDKTGSLVCDASLDNPGTYVSDDGWAYFIVTVKNYDSDDKVSEVPVEYNINVKNATGSNATYRYSTDGSETSNFSDNLITNNYNFTTNSKQTRDIIVEVKTSSTYSEDIDFDIDVNCYQSTK